MNERLKIAGIVGLSVVSTAGFTLYIVAKQVDDVLGKVGDFADKHIPVPGKSQTSDELAYRRDARYVRDPIFSDEEAAMFDRMNAELQTLASSGSDETLQAVVDTSRDDPLTRALFKQAHEREFGTDDQSGESTASQSPNKRWGGNIPPNLLERSKVARRQVTGEEE